jgi:Putative peptidoglycan binding domain/D-alanyl-D-alanine carboxypeptidase
METVKDIIQSKACSTAAVRGLSLQIIAEMNLLVPNVLVSIEGLNIKSTSLAVNPYLQSAAKEALRRAIAAKGGATLEINSTYRTIAQQFLLRSWFEMGACDIADAALPGRSNHEDGLALDTSDFDDWIVALEDENWEWFGRFSPDDVHFSFGGVGVRNDIGDIGVKAFQRLWNTHNPNDLIEDDGLWGDQTAARLRMSPADGFTTKKLLKLIDPNMKGEDIGKVQQALVNAGFLTANKVTDVYDSTTQIAVKNFQEAKGLGKDGIVGTQTRKFLGLPA